MAGEIVKTEGIVLRISPLSRTSHVVTWLTPDHGCVTTLVKGATRPKSAFLGQYDLFYSCELLYYARAAGDLHAIREAVPRRLRESLRGAWRATALAGYAAHLCAELTPPGEEARSWFDFLDAFLETPPVATAEAALRALVALEMKILVLAGLAPDFAAAPATEDWAYFAIDRGRYGEGARTVRLATRTVNALHRPDAAATPQTDIVDAVRFLGLFLGYHLELPPDIRRSLVALLHA